MHYKVLDKIRNIRYNDYSEYGTKRRMQEVQI